jgi:ribosomal protein S18 acetylase RimI-like enzyme
VVAATAPAARGRGVQTALIGRRLVDARAAGAELAVTETVADNASPRNFRRAGFRLLHHRRIYGKTLD